MNRSLAVLAIICLGLISFKSHTGKKPNVFRIAVISDLNAAYGSLNYSPDVSTVINDLTRIKPDMILCAGDMVAGQKASLTEENITGMWQSFKKVVMEPLNRSGIPFGFTVGNHDASPSFKTDRRLAEKFWKTNAGLTRLTFADSAHYPFYFSYVKNDVFFISWDAAGAKIDPDVFTWMEAQLKSRTAQKARLRIVMGHLPLYAIVESKNKPGEVNADPAASLSFFKQHGVDLYISGHQHAYYPARKEGVSLLNTGCIGDGPRQILGHAAAPQKTYTIIEVPMNDARKFSYQTFEPSGTQVSIQSLPDSVQGFNGTIHKQIR